MELTLSTGVFKILNINTYNSMFEVQDDNITYDVSELLTDNHITKNEYDNIIKELYTNFDNSAYMKALGEMATKFIKDNLDLSDIPFPITIIGNGKTYSPKEYNFTGDSLDFDIEVPDNIADILKKWIKDNFDSTFMNENFGSYDGFYSFMPYTYNKMLEVLSEHNHKDLNVVISMIMYQIISKSGNFDKKDFRNEFYELWSEDSNNEITNYLKGNTPFFNKAMDIYYNQIN